MLPFRHSLAGGPAGPSPQSKARQLTVQVAWPTRRATFKSARSVRTDHQFQETIGSTPPAQVPPVPEVRPVDEGALLSCSPAPSSPAVYLETMGEAATVAVRAVSRLLGMFAGGMLLVLAISTSRLTSGVQESVVAAVPQAPEVGLVQQPAASKLPYLTTTTGSAPAITAPALGDAEAATKPAPPTTQPQQAVVHRTPVPKAANKKAAKKGWRKALKKALRKISHSAPSPKVTVRMLASYDPAAASSVLPAGSVAAHKAVVVHSVGELIKAIHSCHAKAQPYALAFTSEHAHKAQHVAFDREVAAQVAQGVAVFVVVLGADFTQRAKLACAEYCGRTELSALCAALDMQGAFGPDVALASLLPGAPARKDFVPARLPCIAFGGLHQRSDVMWEAAASSASVSTSDVDKATWAVVAAMRVLPLSAPVMLADAAEARRAHLHQLSCLRSKLQLAGHQQHPHQQANGSSKVDMRNAGRAASARAAEALAQAQAAEAEAVFCSSFSSSSTEGQRQQSPPPAYLPADVWHMVPTSHVDYLRRHAAATAAGKLLAVVRVSEGAWKDHAPAIRAALAAASPSASNSTPSTVWAEPVLLPLGLDSCSSARSLAPAGSAATAVPALHVGGGGYLAEHWSAAADLLSGHAPAAGLSDMRQAIDLHAMRQRAWLRRREAAAEVVLVEAVQLA